jgi:hypothetical protein
MFACSSVNILTKIFFARRTSPIESAKSSKGGNEENLHYYNRILGKFPEEVGPLIKQNKKDEK